MSQMVIKRGVDFKHTYGIMNWSMSMDLKLIVDKQSNEWATWHSYQTIINVKYFSKPILFIRMR